MIKLFSRSQIVKFEGYVHRNAQRLCDKFLDYKGRGPFESASAYSCFTTDMTTEYFFGKDIGFLEQPDWEPNYRAPGTMMLRLMPLTRHIPLLSHVLDMMPLSLLRPFSPKAAVLMEEIRINMPARVMEARLAVQSGVESDHATVLQALLSSSLPPAEKSIERCTAEANVLVQAATGTTSSVLSFVTYCLLNDSEIYKKVRAELSTVITDVKCLPSWSILEGLPYFSAIILEGLRMASPLDRFSRIATGETLIYQGSWTPPGGSKTAVNHLIPRGYAVAISAMVIHMNEAIFENCSQFKPGRWLDEMGRRKKSLEHYMLSFSKGSRQCLGMQLGYCQLYVVLAAVIMRVLPHMQLHQTTEGDAVYRKVDIAMVKKKSKVSKVVIV